MFLKPPTVPTAVVSRVHYCLSIRHQQFGRCYVHMAQRGDNIMGRPHRVKVNSKDSLLNDQIKYVEKVSQWEARTSKAQCSADQHSVCSADQISIVCVVQIRSA